MRLLQLFFCEELTTIFEGKHYKFVKNVPQEIPSNLADKLLKTGEFIEILPMIMDIDNTATDVLKVPIIEESTPLNIPPKPLKRERKYNKKCSEC